VLLRFWYMTDWAQPMKAVVDNVKIMAGATTVFADDAEQATPSGSMPILVPATAAGVHP